MREKGYVKLHRKTLSSQHASLGIRYIGAFDWLLLNANYYPGFSGGIALEPGQLITGRNKLGLAWVEKPSTAWNILLKLQELRLISVESNNRFSVVTVCNWEAYQSKNNDTGQPVDNGLTTDGQRADNGLTTDGQRADTIIRKKEIKEEEEREEEEAAVSSYDDFNGILFADSTVALLKDAVEKWNRIPWTQDTLGESKERMMAIARLVQLGYSEMFDRWHTRLTESTWLPDQKFARFDWAISEDKFTKICEGNYAGDINNKQSPVDIDDLMRRTMGK